MKKLDVTGQKYGHLVAVEAAIPVGRRTVWAFRCDCGTIKLINLEQVRSGRTTSCGCVKSAALAARSMTHGHSIGRKESRELKSYNHAKSRCFNPNDEKYPLYGGRGIVMCKEWVDDAAKFIADMGPCPPGHTLDRKDPHGNYEPSNCRWATSHQQARTRTDNVLVEYQGAKLVLKDYASLLGISYKALHAKVKYKGKSLEQATAELLRLL